MFVAIYDDTIISAHKTKSAAMKSLMEYAGLTKDQIKEIISNDQDFTDLDNYARIEETLH